MRSKFGLVVLVLVMLVFAAPALAAGDPPQGVELSGPGIAAAVGLLLSLSLAYIPGLEAWWNGWTYKRETLGGVGLAVAVLLVLAHYAGVFDLGLPTRFGWEAAIQAVSAWVAFAGAMQLTYTAEEAV